MSEIDVLNTSWETFQRVINHDQHIYMRNNEETLLSASRLPSFNDIFSYKSPSPIKNSSSEDDSSDSSFFDTLFPPSVHTSNPTIKIEEDMMDEIRQPPQFQEPLPMVFQAPNVFQAPIATQNKIKKEVREFLKRDNKDVFEKKRELEVKIDTIKIAENKSNNKISLNKNTVTPVAKSSSKKSEAVRTIWWNNLSQILSNSMIPLKRCLYKFKNPDNAPWDTEDGLYIFEIHLLQVLCAKEAWNFKRYVDNHSKKAGEGQTFTLCSSIHKDEWEFLDMKSNKFFKKARMININAFKEKNGFITKGKWKYIYNIFQKEFDEQIINANVNIKK